MSQIDETEPGSETDGADGVAEQLSIEDSLLDRGIDDVLDEGYSPPDREPAVRVPTESEEARGSSLNDLLSAEEPDVWNDESNNLFDESGDEVGDQRAGRLVDSDGGGYVGKRAIGGAEATLWSGRRLASVTDQAVPTKLALGVWVIQSAAIAGVRKQMADCLGRTDELEWLRQIDEWCCGDRIIRSPCVGYEQIHRGVLGETE